MTIYKRWQVAIVRFPFSDTTATKPRPVLILTDENFHTSNNHFIAAMITTGGSTKWVGDTPITNLKGTGLDLPCLIRLKLSTLDLTLEPRVIGLLSDPCQTAFLANLSMHGLPIN